MSLSSLSLSNRSPATFACRFTIAISLLLAPCACRSVVPCPLGSATISTGAAAADRQGLGGRCVKSGTERRGCNEVAMLVGGDFAQGERDVGPGRRRRWRRWQR